ncbi:uncharacterized protein LOC106938708 [Poecilia latipinna]|uniref:uncharacterized protein LOC106938708 n=1 Tax=Poecilia latipinna TaxID=48699 RepID=UPI00072EB6B3|nr:PREDICTED: uncharacterized protein LOC106938708 [Poecilia latipinna]
MNREEADTQSAESEMEGEEYEQGEGGEEEQSEGILGAEQPVVGMPCTEVTGVLAKWTRSAPCTEVSGALAVGEVTETSKSTAEEEGGEVAAPLFPVMEGNSQFLSSNHLPSFQTPVSSCLIRDNAWSDHSFLQVEMGRGIRNWGLWCLNAALLRDEAYRGEINVLLQTLSGEMDHADNLLEWWDQAKQRVKNLSIKYSRQKKWRELHNECILRRKLNSELDHLENDQSRDITDYLIIKKQLEQIEINKCKGAIIRSKAKYLTEGEKSTAFFLAQEKCKQTNAAINELLNEKGEKVSDIASILEIVQNFYSQLFTSENISTNKINQVVGVIDSSLSQEDSLCCDAPLTEEEIQHAINSLNNNKSPGHDGITSEFYKQFKDPISKILLRVFSVMEQTGCTPRTFAQGIITILYKNKGERNNLENYRPISSVVSSCLIRDNAWSDHSFLQVEMGRGIRNGGLWCLNAALLRDEAYRGEINVLLQTLSGEMDHADNLLECESDDQDQGLPAGFKEADAQSGEESEMEGGVEENVQVEGGEEELSECMPSAEWSVVRASDAEVSGALAMGEASKNGKNTVEEERGEVAAPLPPVAEENSQLLSPAHLPSFQTPLSA